MLGVALAALRSRRSSSLALWLLAVLVTTAAVSAPYYLLAALHRVVATDVTAAPPGQRMVIMSQQAPASSDPNAVAKSQAAMAAALVLPAATTVTGMRVSGDIGGKVGKDLAVAYRDGVCAHVVVDGACPTGDRDAMVSRTLAGVLGAHLGDPLVWPGVIVGKPPVLRIVGIYEPLKPLDPYWGLGLLTSSAGAGAHEGDAVFVTPAAMTQLGQVVTCERLVVINVGTVDQLGADEVQARVSNIHILTNSFDANVAANAAPMVARIDADADRLRTSIPLLAVEVVAFGWFALYIVLRAIATARRGDVGLLLLRGTPRFRMWWLLTLQSALPVLVGAPFGIAAGYFGTRWLAGPVAPSQAKLAAALGGAAVVLVLIGALIAAAAAERRSRRTPVTELLRQTPAPRRGWRADVIDVIVIGLAGFGLVQTKISGASTPGIVALTPVLIAVTAGLIAGRLLRPIAARFITGSLRAGRTTGLLTAIYLARRGGLDRIFALLVISVALAANATMTWHQTSVAQGDRAAVELGADRVIDVRDANVQQVLTVTRAADPDGRYLMATSTYRDTNTGVTVLAVDSPRLGAVLAAGGWPGGDALAGRIRPTEPTGVRITASRLRLDLAAHTLPVRPVDLILAASDDQGGAHLALFGPLSSGTTDYTAALAGCAGGCTFTSLRVGFVPAPDGEESAPPTTDVGVVIESLDAVDSGDNATITPALALTDRLRWHTSLATNLFGPLVSTGPDGLHLDLAADEQHGIGVNFDPAVYPSDTPVPLPVVVAGALPPSHVGGVTAVAPFGDISVAMRVETTVPVLPHVAAAGAYVDLEYALRLDGGAGLGGSSQIWLRADTPAPVLAALHASGLVFVDEHTIRAAEAGYRRQATQATLWFVLAGAAISLLAGVVALLLVAATERETRRVELTSLRRQGVSGRTVRRSASAGYATLAIGALAVGLLAVYVDGLVIGAHPAIFADGWSVVPPPSPGAGWGWPLAVLVGVPLLVAAYLSARRLGRSVAVETGDGGTGTVPTGTVPAGGSR